MTTKKTFYSLFAIFTLLLSSCSVDSSNSFQSEPEPSKPTAYVPGEATLRSFDIMFPNAKNVTWEKYDVYDVVNFTEYSASKNAWFDQKGTWYLSKTAVSSNKMPAAISQAFSASSYAASQVKTSSLLERKDLADVYVLNISENTSDVNLYYSENGDLIKKAKSSTDLPVTISNEIKSFIAGHYPQAQMLDIWNDIIGSKVCIIDDNTFKVVALDSGVNWISTIINVTEDIVPEVVMNGFKNSRHGEHNIIEIKYAYLSSDNLYYFYFDADDKHKVASVKETGSLVATISY